MYICMNVCIVACMSAVIDGERSNSMLFVGCRDTDLNTVICAMAHKQANIHAYIHINKFMHFTFIVKLLIYLQYFHLPFSL